MIDRKQQQGKLILTYHNVLPTSALTPFFTNNVDIAADIFEFHLKSILQKFKIQTASEIVEPGKKGIYLSLDDGMLNHIEIVEPILKKYRITAMFGVVSGLVKNDIEFIWRDQIFLMLKSLLNKKLVVPDQPSISGKKITKENLNKTASTLTEYIQVNYKMDHVYEYLDNILSMNNLFLKRNSFPKLRYSPMNITDVKYLQGNGHLIASHTHTHRKLSMLSDMEIVRELKISRDYCVKELGECDTLVYPYGSANEVNNKVRDLASEAGYKHAFVNTTKGFEKNNLFIPRINMGNISTKAQFFGIVAGVNRLFK